VDETLECAFLHLLSRYNPPRGECDFLHSRGCVMMYETEPPVLAVVPVRYILGKLPVVRAGDTGRIPFAMRGKLLRDNCYSEGRCDTSETDTSGSTLYFVNRYAMTWSRAL